jgi:hypothetical protein
MPSEFAPAPELLFSEQVFKWQRAKRSLANTMFRKCVNSLRQLFKKVALFRHNFLLIFNSSFMISFNVARCFGVRSDISSLSHNVNSQAL